MEALFVWIPFQVVYLEYAQNYLSTQYQYKIKEIKLEESSYVTKN